MEPLFAWNGSCLFLSSIAACFVLAKKPNTARGRQRKKSDDSWAALGYWKQKSQREHRTRTSVIAQAWNSLSKEEKATLVALVRQQKNQQDEKLESALLHGVDVCIDLSYEKQQTIGELRSLARQLSNTYAMVKRAAVLCHLHITSVGTSPGRDREEADTDRNGFIEAILGEGVLGYLYDQLKHPINYLLPAFGVLMSSRCDSKPSVKWSTTEAKRRGEQAAGDNTDTLVFLEKMGYANWKISKHAEGPSAVASASAATAGYANAKPAKTVVYLSPDAPESLTRFDNDCVYVIGGIVDCTVRSGLTFEQAQSLGAVSRRLPIQEHVPEYINRVLNIDCCVHIVCTYLETQDWAETFRRTLPKRKLIKGGKAERYKRNKENKKIDAEEKEKEKEKEKDVGNSDADNGERDGEEGNDDDSGEGLGGSLEARAVNSRWIRWIEREVGLEYGTKDKDKV